MWGCVDGAEGAVRAVDGALPLPPRPPLLPLLQVSPSVDPVPEGPEAFRGGELQKVEVGEEEGLHPPGPRQRVQPME